MTMTRNEMREALAVLHRLLLQLRATIPAPHSDGAVTIRRVTGDVEAYAEGLISFGAIGEYVGVCFTVALEGGATFEAFDRVRTMMLAEVLTGAPAKVIQHLGVRLCLTHMVRALAAMEFTSREDAEHYVAKVRDAFEVSEIFAADELDQAVYTALVSLRAACVRDMADRARLLPRVITYTTADARPALTLSNRLYPGDASRAQQLVIENKAPHPAFMPITGRYLAK
jgi:hypothetical protein